MKSLFPIEFIVKCLSPQPVVFRIPCVVQGTLSSTNRVNVTLESPHCTRRYQLGVHFLGQNSVFIFWGYICKSCVTK
jgi:hypothetical protein